MFDDFLSDQECDALRNVHDKHVRQWSEETPILCFESEDTLRRNLHQVGKGDLDVHEDDFTVG